MKVNFPNVGIEIEFFNEGPFTAKDFWVYTGKITNLPNGKDILTDEFAKLMNTQTLKGVPIVGTEWFATSYQRIGSNVGVAVKQKIDLTNGEN